MYETGGRDIMIPSSQQVAENIQRTVESLAKEIGRRVGAVTSETTAAVAEVEARRVLLDWFLGDFMPTAMASSLEPREPGLQK
jgi:hypothetical protein